MSPEALQDEIDDRLFEFAVIKPSHLTKFIRTFKKKKAIQDHLGWYFRPRSQFEPERVDYNCLNILAEYQCYNFEFAKDTLELNKRQTANVLDVFWQLLEFNPDSEDAECGDQLQKERSNIAFIGDDILDAEEERMRQLLAGKFALYKNLILGAIEHPDADTRITVEHARRITAYAHETFFRHLRLYDYVLKNTKLCEVKKVTLPKAEPKCGDPLGKAMLLGVTVQETDDEISQACVKSEYANESAQKEGEFDEAVEIKKDTERCENEEMEFDEGLRTSTIDIAEKQVIHRLTKQWNSKIDQAK